MSLRLACLASFPLLPDVQKAYSVAKSGTYPSGKRSGAVCNSDRRFQAKLHGRNLSPSTGCVAPSVLFLCRQCSPKLPDQVLNLQSFRAELPAVSRISSTCRICRHSGTTPIVAARIGGRHPSRRSSGHRTLQIPVRLPGVANHSTCRLAIHWGAPRLPTDCSRFAISVAGAGVQGRLGATHSARG